MKSPNDLLPIDVPSEVATCPICGTGIYIDEVQDWIEDGDRYLIARHTSVSVDCNEAPDIDDTDAFDDFMRSHWSTPYIDWLPIQQTVTKWLATQPGFGEFNEQG